MLGPSPSQSDRQTEHLDGARGRMVQFAHHLEGGRGWVAQGLVDAEYRSAGHAGFAERGQPVLGGRGPEPSADQIVQFATVLHPGGVCGEASVSAQVAEVQRPAERPEHGVVSNRQVQVAILGGEGPVGGDHRMHRCRWVGAGSRWRSSRRPGR